MSYHKSTNPMTVTKSRAVVFPSAVVGMLTFLISGGLDAQDVASPSQTGPAVSRRMLVDPSSTTLTLGKINLVVGPLTPRGAFYFGDYQIKVVPYFFKSEKGTLKLNAPDGTAQKFAERSEVKFTGRATNDKGEKPKVVTGKATPSDQDKGSVTFSIETDNGPMTFTTSYRFAK
jgi:hypothetical protein